MQVQRMMLLMGTTEKFNSVYIKKGMDEHGRAEERLL